MTPMMPIVWQGSQGYGGHSAGCKHEDIFWTIRQIVKRRDLIVKGNVMNKNQLHS